MVAQWKQLCERPFMLKGVGRVDNAKGAVDSRLDAISVSNHGGNNLTALLRRSGCSSRSPTPWATRSRSSWTAAYGVGRARREGARLRCPRGDDRPRLSVGSGRQRPGRRRERTRHPQGPYRLRTPSPGLSSIDELTPEHLLIPRTLSSPPGTDPERDGEGGASASLVDAVSPGVRTRRAGAGPGRLRRAAWRASAAGHRHRDGDGRRQRAGTTARRGGGAGGGLRDQRRKSGLRRHGLWVPTPLPRPWTWCRSRGR